MTNQQDLEARMTHLEDEIAALAETVDDMVHTINDFLGDVGALQVGFLRLRRYAATNQMQTTANLIHNWLLKVVENPDSSASGKVCDDFLGRRYALTLGKLPHSNEPEKDADEFKEAVTKLCREHGFNPFIAM